MRTTLPSRWKRKGGSLAFSNAAAQSADRSSRSQLFTWISGRSVSTPGLVRDVLPVGAPILKRVAPMALSSPRTRTYPPGCDHSNDEDGEENDHGCEQLIVHNPIVAKKAS